MTPKPSGTVAFLFTDIEGSTVLAQRHPDKLVVGDSFSAAFHSASDALGAALDAQIQLHYEDWGDAPIKVRMGIDTGIAELADDPHTQGAYSGYA
ncbi:MAG TPA: hypothetical protein VFQ23_13700, partial [Anaerolineales bacterium]|nr:hypothetical protein [Anaerolineales bacterium]